jgi:hypothetical protein
LVGPKGFSMRAFIAIAAVFIAIGPAKTTLSTNLQNNGVHEKPAIQVVMFAVEGMT